MCAVLKVVCSAVMSVVNHRNTFDFAVMCVLGCLYLQILCNRVCSILDFNTVIKRFELSEMRAM